MLVVLEKSGFGLGKQVNKSNLQGLTISFQWLVPVYYSDFQFSSGVITLDNHSKRTQWDKPIRLRSKYSDTRGKISASLVLILID